MRPGLGQRRLARLLDVRRVIVLRNSGHTVAKLLDAIRVGPSFRVVNFTHPECAHLSAEFAADSHVSLLLTRGTEGEPVADPRRLPRLDVFIGGNLRGDLSQPPHEGVLSELPLLPQSRDAATTAVYIQSVIGSEKPAPTPLVRQVDVIARAIACMAGDAAAKPAA